MKIVSSSIIDDLNDYYKFYNSCFLTDSRTSLLETSNVSLLLLSLLSLVKTILIQVSVSFINNTADENGAAIYATTLTVCTRVRPDLKEEEAMLLYSNYYDNSLFTVKPLFQFKYGNIYFAIHIIMRIFFPGCQEQQGHNEHEEGHC